MKWKVILILGCALGLFHSEVAAQWSTSGSDIYYNSGNIGIGTTSPSERLHIQNGNLLINNGSQFIQSHFHSTNDYARFMFNGSYNYLISYGATHSSDAHKIALKANHSSGGIGFFTNSVERLSVASSGNIGIGTTNPGKLLHLKNENWQQLVFDRTEITGVDDLFYIGPSYGEAGVEADGLRFSSTGDNNMLFLQASGKVGIGTLNPSDKLTVNGTAKAEEVIVTENVGADFVFEEDYTLPDLSELEAFLRTHKHLPQVPTAEEMIRDGVKMGELQMKLLQKIEELTLYAIGQENTSKHMENNQRKLQDQVERLTEKNEELTLHMVEQQKLIMKQQNENRQLRRRLEKVEKILNVSSN